MSKWRMLQVKNPTAYMTALGGVWPHRQDSYHPLDSLTLV